MSTSYLPVYLGSYLRVVITTRCPLACDYCHMEGDPAQPGAEGGLETAAWIELLRAALDTGVRKLKFVGGEPLIRRDLPEIIASLRARAADLDISVITSGAVPRQALDRCYEAGLSRCNVTVHGFRPADFTLRGGAARHYALRTELIEAALEHGRPLKLNYVYTGARCERDLTALLDWAAPRACVVNVLDDLSRPELSHESIYAALRRLRGEPVMSWDEPDPYSLPTQRLRFADGLTVEVKNRRLGEAAPWASCSTCPQRQACREGIVALRLTHTGLLRPCMDRADLGVPLLPALRAGGIEGARAAWSAFMRGEGAL